MTECDLQMHSLQPNSSILRQSEGQFGFGLGHPYVYPAVSVSCDTAPAKRAGNAIGPLSAE